MWKLIPTATAVIALAIAGCGDSAEEASGPPSEYLPADANLLAVVDLDAVRADLELPDDADATDVDSFSSDDFDLTSPEVQLVNVAALAVPPVRLFGQTLERSPLLEALDGSAISAAAGTLIGSPEEVAAIRTTQAFDDLAAALEDEGYERDGETLTNPDQPIGVIADSGDGVWVMGNPGEGPSAADLAASPPGGPEALSELLAEGDGTIGIATSLVAKDPSAASCMLAFGGHESADGTEGDFVFTVDGEAEADRVNTEPLDGVTPGEPTVEGSTATIPFTSDPQPAGNPVSDLLAQFGFPELYRCD